jgi:hypothetical protein
MTQRAGDGSAAQSRRTFSRHACRSLGRTLTRVSV